LVTNFELAESALSRSERWLQGASRALEDRRWDDVVFSSQMAIEVSSKAVLLTMGVDFPKQHDVSSVFRELAKNRAVPRWFPVEKLASNISTFAEMRALAEYAYERGVGGEHFKKGSREALDEAATHVAACKRLIRTLKARARPREGGKAGSLKSP